MRKISIKGRNWAIIALILGLISLSLLFIRYTKEGIAAGILVGIALSIYLSIGMTRLNRLCWRDKVFISLYIFPMYLTIGIFLGSLSNTFVVGITKSLSFSISSDILISLDIGLLTTIILLYSIESKYSTDRFSSSHHRFIKLPGNFLIVRDVKNFFIILAILSLGLLFALLTYFVNSYTTTLVSFYLLVSFYCTIGILVWSIFRKHSLKAVPISKAMLAKEPNKMRGTAKSDVKMILIGLDGLTWDVINPLLKKNKLPNIARLVENGSYGYLQTLEPTFTPIIWTSIATGKLPNKHWVVDFLVWNIKGIKSSIRKFPSHFGIKTLFDVMDAIMPFTVIESGPVTSESWNSKSLWEILSENDKKVGVVGWYPTWPAYPVNGFLVTDRAHCLNLENRFYPESLNDQVRDLIELPHRYHFSFRDTVRSLGPVISEIDRFINILEGKSYDYVPCTNANKTNILEIFKFEYLKDKTYMNIARYLLKKREVDFFAVYLHGTDAVAHCFWKWREPGLYINVPKDEIKSFGDVIDKYYIYMDSFIGELLENIDERTIVMIVSDHGERPLYGGHGVHESQSTHDISTPGVIIIYGKHIKKRKRLDHATVLDITPTILYLMGIPIGKDMDGDILVDSIEKDFLRRNSIDHVPSYETSQRRVSTKGLTSDVDDEIKRQLKALGYL